MTDVTYKQLWVESIQKRRGDLLTVADRDPFKSWDEMRVPLGTVGGSLDVGLDVLYSGLDPALGRRLIERSQTLIARTEQDKKLDAEAGRVGFFVTRAEFLLDKALTIALLHGGTHKELFRASAQDFVAWVFESGKRPSAWHDQEQSFFLEAVLCLLICSDLSEASALFARATDANWYHAEAAMLRDLCIEWLSAGRLSESLKAMLWNRFDVVRNPKYDPEVFVFLSTFRLEFGVIMWKYVLENKGDIDWNEVIELVSR